MFIDVSHVSTKLTYEEASTLLEEKNSVLTKDKKFRFPTRHEMQTFSADRTADKSCWNGVVYWIESGDKHDVSGVVLNTGISKSFSRTGTTLSVVFVR